MLISMSVVFQDGKAFLEACDVYLKVDLVSLVLVV